MSEYIEFVVCVPKDEADLFIARFGRKNVKILGCLLSEEIVRCYKCRHHRVNVWTMGDKRGTTHTCERERKQVAVEPDGFCAWGERDSAD